MSVVGSGQNKEVIGNGQEHLSTGTDHRKTEGGRNTLKQGTDGSGNSPPFGDLLRISTKSIYWLTILFDGNRIFGLVLLYTSFYY